MSRKNYSVLAVALVLIGMSAALLAWLRTHQRLGAPAVTTRDISGGIQREVILPERVLEYDSELVKTPQNVIDFLPKDTSYGQRRYTAPDKFFIDQNVILMGTDRTSIHKAKFCLAGQGWRIDEQLSTYDQIHIDRPQPYELPVMKLLTTKQVTDNKGQSLQVKGIYVYWFVAENELTARHLQRVWWMARDMMLTGVLQRWAYVSYFAVCLPGQEAATFERMKKMIAASVPEFQLTPRPSASVTALR